MVGIMRTITGAKRSEPCRGVAATLMVGCLALAGALQEANAGSREQAKRIHDRLAGVPPSDAVLTAMQQDIDNSQPLQAAYKAMDNKGFYNVTLKNWVTPWTNRDQSVFAPLNDYTATVIGIIRDDKDFREILSGDILYVGASGTGYSNTNNVHYEQLEASGANLGDTNVLLERTQSGVTGLDSSATAGVMTTRAAARAFFIAGTNRAMFRFTMLNHLCNDMEQVKDITRPADRIRRDVSRSPGGDSRIFLNNCVGCHSGMDPLSQAYAYYQFQYQEGQEDSGQLIYTPGAVQPKHNVNAENFEYGYIIRDDSWSNYWRQGPNANFLGWNVNSDANLTGSGNGAKTMGAELANSEAFARCQVQKAFRAVCLRDPVDNTDVNQITQITTEFTSGYNMKDVFAKVAVYCAGN